MRYVDLNPRHEILPFTSVATCSGTTAAKRLLMRSSSSGEGRKPLWKWSFLPEHLDFFPGGALVSSFPHDESDSFP
jgi:hypothetical protein